jgi:hypothetical protein
MEGHDRRELDRELARCAKVGIRTDFGPIFDEGRGRWIVRLRTELGRVSDGRALTPAMAVKNARTTLGYRAIDGDLVYERAAS